MADEFRILVAEEVHDFLEGLDGKSSRIVRENLEKLENPYPGQGKGDKERIEWRGEQVYRLQVGRTWTAFYDIIEGRNTVKVFRVMPINQAHDEYGSLD